MARGWAGLSEEFVGGRALSGVCPRPGAGLGSVRSLFPARSRAQPCRASGAASSLWPLCISHKQHLQAPGARWGSAPAWGSPPVPGAGCSSQSRGCHWPPLAPNPPPGARQARTCCSSCWRMRLLFPVSCSIISVAFSDSLSALRGWWTEFLTRRRKYPWTDASSLAALCPSLAAWACIGRDLASTQEIAV